MSHCHGIAQEHIRLLDDRLNELKERYQKQEEQLIRITQDKAYHILLSIHKEQSTDFGNG